MNKIYKEEILEFGLNNYRMIGVVSKPLVKEDNNTDTIIILVPYGLNPRFGPHRIHVLIARQMCAKGFAVFRFDSYGCGDSEGDISSLSGLHRDDVFWRLVFDGHFLEDVSAAISCVERSFRPKNIVLAGICGGAVRSLLVGSKCPSVKGIIAIGFPSTIDDTSLDSVEKMNPQMAKFYISTYAWKLLSLRAWMRILSFKSEYRRIFKVITLIAKSRLVNEQNANPSCSKLESSQEYAKGRVVNSHLINAIMESLKNGKRILTIFGGNDRYLGDFEKIVEEPHLSNARMEGCWDYSKFVIINSNHEFSFAEWQNKLVDKIGEWMQKRFTV